MTVRHEADGAPGEREGAPVELGVEIHGDRTKGVAIVLVYDLALFLPGVVREGPGVAPPLTSSKAGGGGDGSA